MPLDNIDTDVDTMTTRYRAKRGQSTLNVELGLINAQSFNSSSVGSSTGGGGGTVGGAGVVNVLTGGTSPGGSSCPELSQFTLIRGENGQPIPTLVKYVEVGFYLWSPFTNTFEKVIKAEVIEDVDLWHITDGSVSGTGSPSHPLIQGENDKSGIPLTDCYTDMKAAAVCYGSLCETAISVIDHYGHGSVKHLETEGPTHIYCAGWTADEMFVWHNQKPFPDD